MKTKGAKNYFQSDKTYTVTDVIPYIKKNNSKLIIPPSWESGGDLIELVRDTGGFAYDKKWTRKGEFSGKKMYKIADFLVEYLKNPPRKSKLPLEKMAKKEEPSVVSISTEIIPTETYTFESVVCDESDPTFTSPFLHGVIVALEQLHDAVVLLNEDLKERGIT